MSWWQSFLEGIREFFRHDHAQQSGVTLEHAPNPGPTAPPSAPATAPVETVAVAPKAESPPVVRATPPAPAPVQVVQAPASAGVDWGGLVKTGLGAVTTGMKLFANNHGSTSRFLGANSSESDSSIFNSSDSDSSDSEDTYSEESNEGTDSDFQNETEGEGGD